MTERHWSNGTHNGGDTFDFKIAHIPEAMRRAFGPNPFLPVRGIISHWGAMGAATEDAGAALRLHRQVMIAQEFRLIGPEPRRAEYLRGRSAVGYRQARRRWGRAKKRLRRLGWGERTTRQVMTYLPTAHVHIEHGGS